MPTPPDFGEYGFFAALLWFISSLSFAFMMALVGRSGRRASWFMTFLGVMFAISFTWAAVLVEGRRSAQMADVRFAQNLLDGRWATLLDPAEPASFNCQHSTVLKMNSDRRLSELTSQGFVYLYNAYIIVDDKAVHALNPDNRARVVYRPGEAPETLIKMMSLPEEEPVRMVLKRCSS